MHASMHTAAAVPPTKPNWECLWKCMHDHFLGVQAMVCIVFEHAVLEVVSNARKIHAPTTVIFRFDLG